MSLFFKRILQCPDAFGRVILQYPIKNQGVVSIDKRSVALVPGSAAPAGSELLEIGGEGLAIVRIRFPFLVRDQSVLIDVLFQQTIVTIMVNSGRDVYCAEAKGLREKQQSERHGPHNCFHRYDLECMVQTKMGSLNRGANLDNRSRPE